MNEGYVLIGVLCVVSVIVMYMGIRVLEVGLSFSGKLTKQQIEKVVKQVTLGLKDTADGRMIVPEDAEEYTESIIVSDPNTGVTLFCDMSTGKIY